MEEQDAQKRMDEEVRRAEERVRRQKEDLEKADEEVRRRAAEILKANRRPTVDLDIDLGE